MRTVLTEELTGIVCKDVGIRQDGFISFVLIGKILKQVDGLVELLIRSDQRVFDLTGVVVKNLRRI